MSIVVIHEGHRRNVKIIGPNTIIQDIIINASEQFNSLDPSRYILKYRKNTIPKSQLFRFSNIPHNAVVDLVLDDSNRVSTPCKIAFSFPSGGSVIKSFDCKLTLQQTLSILFQEESHIQPPNSLNDIAIIYMRNSYTGDILNTMTLEALGLTGSSARFLLKYEEGYASSLAVLSEDKVSNESKLSYELTSVASGS